MTSEQEELDEWMCRAFNPDDLIDVVLPCGAVARVSPNVSAETLHALNHLMLAAIQLAEGAAP